MQGLALAVLLAKVASAVAKPDGLLVVPAGGERAFLHPLPVEALWGVGPATAGRLRARGLATVGQVARLDETALVALLGQAVGRKMHALAHNRDPRPVRRGRGRRRSVGSQCARDFTSRPPEAMDRTLVALADRVARRTRRSGRRRPAGQGAEPAGAGSPRNLPPLRRPQERRAEPWTTSGHQELDRSEPK